MPAFGGWRKEDFGVKVRYTFSLLFILGLWPCSGNETEVSHARAALPLSTRATMGRSWQIECVDCPKEFRWMTDRSLQLDHADRPHIAYGYDHLYYAHYDGTEWHHETVDSAPEVGSYAALALDLAGMPHISYHHSWNGDLNYARQTFHTLKLEKEAVPRQGVHIGDPLTYTLTLYGPGASVQLWDRLPDSVVYVPDSVRPPAVYSPTARAILWEGVLLTGTAQVLEFQVTVGIDAVTMLSLSPPFVNTAWLTDTENGVSISATVIINGWPGYLLVVVRQ